MHTKLQSLLEEYDNDIKVLYVEDCENTRIAALNILKNYFNHIDIANDGQDGLNKFQELKFNYDLILTDLDMPVKDGISMIEDIRKIDKNVYIVVFSVQNDPEFFIETINLGINGYLLKPFKIQQFTDIAIKFIEHLIGKKPLQGNLSKSENNVDQIKLQYDYYWDKKNKSLSCDNKRIDLTKNEIKLFEYLSSSLCSTKPTNELGSFIFDNYSTDDNSRLRNLIAKLKHKTGGNSLIDSSYGIGYKLKIL